MLSTLGTVEISFSIVVHLIDGTATNAQSHDYHTNEILSLQYPADLCRTIQIFDDQIFEGNEDFGLSIFSVGIAGNPVLALLSPVKTVIIQDNEGNLDNYVQL